MKPIRLLIVAGSARAGAYSLSLARVAAAAARRDGCEATELDLRALALPLYDGDLELALGVPPVALRLRDALASHDAMLLVTPEYNGFPTPLVLNAFDWMSRIPATAEGGAGLAAAANKPAALLSSSPGPLGGLRAMTLMRQYLQGNFAMIVVPQQYALGRAGDAFDEAGALKDAKAQHMVEQVLTALGDLATALRPR
jgi:NAD(P)H-dependent FMN reductase